MPCCGYIYEGTLSIMPYFGYMYEEEGTLSIMPYCGYMYEEEGTLSIMPYCGYMYEKAPCQPCPIVDTCMRRHFAHHALFWIHV